MKVLIVMVNALIVYVGAMVISMCLGCSDVEARVENWNGFGDTSGITDFKADSLKYGKVWSWGKYGGGASLVVMVNDTSAAGFANDSVKIQYGYQLGWPMLGLAGVMDTLWLPYAAGAVDTLDGTEMGNATAASWLDTLGISGVATSARNLNTNWAPLIRAWAKGLTGNEKGTAEILRFGMQKQLYTPSGRGD